MRILYYMEQPNTPMALWQNVHIVDELAHHNIEVEIFNPLKYASTAEANENVLAAVKGKPYDLFMSVHNEEILYNDTLKQIKATGIPTLLICWDSLTVPFVHRNVAPLYDLVWLTEGETKPMFDKWGAKSIVLLCGANPYFFQYRPQPEKYDVAFVGTPYGSRANVINELLSRSIPVALYTSSGGTTGGASAAAERESTATRLKKKAALVGEFASFPVGRKLLLSAALQKTQPASRLMTDSPVLTTYPQVSFEQMSDLYSSHALCLATTAVRNTGILKHPVDAVHLRSFEIPMCGGIQFARYTPELAEYFEEDVEALFYRSNEEMADKAKFYLAPEREAQRKAIRQAARKRAEGEHTWYHRFSKAFEALDLRHP